MSENEVKLESKLEVDENGLPDMLVPGPRKSHIVAQFMGRINRRNPPLPPVTMFVAPTGKAAAQLNQLSDAPQGSEHQMLSDDLEPGILKPKFW